MEKSFAVRLAFVNVILQLKPVFPLFKVDLYSHANVIVRKENRVEARIHVNDDPILKLKDSPSTNFA